MTVIGRVLAWSATIGATVAVGYGAATENILIVAAGLVSLVVVYAAHDPADAP